MYSISETVSDRAGVSLVNVRRFGEVDRIFDYGCSKLGTGASDFRACWGFESQLPYNYYYLLQRKGRPSVSHASPTSLGASELLWRPPPKITQLVERPMAKYLG